MTRYQLDHVFRESVRSSNRRTARRYYGLHATYSDVDLPRRKDQREKFGKVRKYLTSGKVQAEALCFTVKEFASLIGKCKKTVDLWLASERLPKPISITIVRDPCYLAVYTEEQACRMIDILTEHFKEKFTLSEDDISTRTKLIEAVYGPHSTITRPA